MNSRRLRSGLVVACVLLTSSAVRAQPPDPVQAYLQRLNLPEYEVAFLELEYAKPARRDVVAPRLAEAYVDRLLDIDSPAEASEVTQKVKDLVKRHPTVNSVRVQLLLTQGEYTRAEALAGKWILDPGDKTSAKVAAETLDRILPDLDRHAAEQGKILARETEAMEKPRGAARKPVEERVNRSASCSAGPPFSPDGELLPRAAATADGQLGDASYRKARDAFRKLVGFDEPPAELDADELRLSSPVRARAILGLAMSEAATGGAKASQEWFTVLEHRDVPDAVREALVFWKLFALLRHGDPAAAADFARSAVDGFTEYSAPRRNVCVLLIRAGGPLADLGMRGLIQMRQYELAKKLGAAAVTDETSPAGRLIQAMNRLDAAERSKTAADFKTAAAAFEAIAADAERRRVGVSLASPLRKPGMPSPGPRTGRAARCWIHRPGPQGRPVRPGRGRRLVPHRAYDKLAAKDPQTKLKLADLLRFGSSFPDHPKSKAAGPVAWRVPAGAVAADKINPGGQGVRGQGAARRQAGV